MKCYLCGKRIWRWQKRTLLEEIKEVDYKGIPLDFINPHLYDIHFKCMEIEDVQKF